jgi:hypothetical protein
MSGFKTGALGFGHVVLRSVDREDSTLGRHSNDQMVSFYMSTPSGFEVEYGWGGRLIDDATWQVQRHDRGTLWGHKLQLDAPPPPAPQPVAR